MRSIPGLTCAGLLLIAACGDHGQPDREPLDGAPIDTASAEVATRDGEMLPPPAPEAPEPAAAGAHLALEGEGLRVFLEPSGTARPIPFGMPSAAALEALEDVLARAPAERGDSPDCGGAYARWDHGLTIRFSRGRFVGWSLSDSTASLTTATGIGIGSTRSDIERAHVMSVQRSTLGEEFTVGALAGILDTPEPQGRVTALWAGEACLAR